MPRFIIDPTLPRPGWQKTEVRFCLCSTCGGEGKIIVTSYSFDGDSDRMHPTDTEVETCEDCGGAGEIEQPVEPVERDDDMEPDGRSIIQPVST